MAPVAEFEVELNVFERHRKEWLNLHLGKFVAIKGEAVAGGFFDTYAEAFKAGLRAFGALDNFLVKQVWKTDPVYFVS